MRLCENKFQEICFYLYIIFSLIFYLIYLCMLISCWGIFLSLALFFLRNTWAWHFIALFIPCTNIKCDLVFLLFSAKGFIKIQIKPQILNCSFLFQGWDYEFSISRDELLNYFLERNVYLLENWSIFPVPFF